MKMIKLRECPFCGSTMIGVYEWAIYDWAAQCDYCHSTGMHAASADDAAKAWNTRKEDKKKNDFKTKSAATYGASVRGE